MFLILICHKKMVEKLCIKLIANAKRQSRGTSCR